MSLRTTISSASLIASTTRIALYACAVLFAPGCGDSSNSTSPVLLQFGRTGIGACEFNYPRAIARAPSGEIFVVDKAGRIQGFSDEGAYRVAWRMPEIRAGKPTGLGIGPDGRVYAADTHYARVKIFKPDGTPDGEFGGFGDVPGQFRLPTDVAIDTSGNVYVSEYGGNDRISRFTPDLKCVATFPDRAKFPLNRPQSLAFDRDGSLWVADSCNHRIVRLSPDGEVLAAFGSLGEAPGEFRFPYNVEPLSDGTIVVCEYGNNRVQHLTRDGKSLGFWGRAGRETGQLAYPWALTVGRNDRVYAVDSGNNRVQVFDGSGRSSWRATP